jgi:hypothetical protein
MNEPLSFEDAVEIREGYQQDPVTHIKVIQGVESLEEYQERICNAIRDHERVCISACHDIGKTFSLSKVVLWFLPSFPGSKIISTAPTHNQVKRLLWSEIRNGWRKSKMPLGGNMLQTEWQIDDDWFAVGFTSRNEANSGEAQGTSSSFQGFHAEYILIIFDEATGIPHNIWTQAEGMLTSAKVRFVAIGNPTSRASEFFKCFSSPAWHKIYLSCFDSPNLKANGITNIEQLRDEFNLLKSLSEKEAFERIRNYKVVQPKLLTLSWVMQAALKWGLTHPLFVSKVLGKFPEEDENVLISLSTVEAAQNRYEDLPKGKKTDIVSLRSIGVDPARFGADMTVITVLEDDVQTLRKVLSKNKTTEVTGEIVALLKSLPRARQEVIVVDGTGIGAGVCDELQEARNSKHLPSNVVIREVHFGGGLTTEDDKKHYFNLKAKMFDRLSKDLYSTLAIIGESTYLEQFPTILYKFTSKGQLIIESKDDYKKRTGLGSPDDADSMALANHGRYPEQTSGKFVASTAGTRQIRSGDIIGGGDAW